MKNQLLISLATLFLLSICGCVEQLPFNPPLPDDRLVVDGYISDQTDLMEVRLTTAAGYGSNANPDNFNFPVTDAEVTIVESTGQSWNLLHQPTDPGLYLRIPNTIPAKVGESYEVVIQWEGKTYRSRPDRMPAPVPFDSVYSTFLLDSVTNDFGVELPRCRHQIRVSLQDPADQPNHYLWRYKYLHEIETAVTLSTLEKCFVFVDEVPQFEVLNDDLTDGSDISGFVIGNIEYNFWHPKYLVDVFQFHLSAEAYTFWNQIQQQREQVGGIFDPPPSTIRGNMYCVDDSTEVVYGFFRASSVTTDYFLFSRMNAPCPPDPLRQDACFQIFNSTSQDPPDPRWQ